MSTQKQAGGLPVHLRVGNKILCGHAEYNSCAIGPYFTPNRAEVTCAWCLKLPTALEQTDARTAIDGLQSAAPLDENTTARVQELDQRIHLLIEFLRTIDTILASWSNLLGTLPGRDVGVALRPAIRQLRETTADVVTRSVTAVSGEGR